MKLLAIDSSAKVAAAAVCSEERILAETQLHTGLTHSQTLVPICKALLDNARVSLAELDGFALSAGPGSFTGLRIGMAVVKGMAFAAGKLCYPVSTLEALAYNLTGCDGVFCPVMDARRDQVYNALFRAENGNITRLCEDRAISVRELGETLATYSEPIWLCGDGAELCHSAFGKELPAVQLAPLALRYQKASSVALVAFQHKEAVSAATLLPSYLRLPQAERERAERLAENKQI